MQARSCERPDFDSSRSTWEHHVTAPKIMNLKPGAMNIAEKTPLARGQIGVADVVVLNKTKLPSET